MAESYREKRARIRKEQKKRFQARKMTGGAGDPRAAAKKMYEMMDQMEAIA